MNDVDYYEMVATTSTATAHFVWLTVIVLE